MITLKMGHLVGVLLQGGYFLGEFQWVAAQTLIMFGLGAAHAKRFAFILWAVVTLRLLVIDFMDLAGLETATSPQHRRVALPFLTAPIRQP